MGVAETHAGGGVQELKVFCFFSSEKKTLLS
jgi:hypothetical protein